MKDQDFIRGKVPMTKEHVRTVTLEQLKLKPDSKCLDIGAGTGSVSVEMACKARNGFVTAIEVNPEGVDLIHKNMKQAGINHYEVIEGLAPTCLPQVSFDSIFIGGSKGNLPDLLDYAYVHLPQGGRLVMNFITMENVYLALNLLKTSNFTLYDGVQLQAMPLKRIGNSHMFSAENSVYIIWAEK